jgi:hypothetical protein
MGNVFRAVVPSEGFQKSVISGSHCYRQTTTENTKTTDRKQSNKEAVYVVLDIVKKTQEALVLFPGGKRLSMKVKNSLIGYDLLYQRCGGGELPIVCAFEPTADYQRNIAFWLADKGCECQLVSSISIVTQLNLQGRFLP